MEIGISLNNISLYNKLTKPGIPDLCPENPSYTFIIHTPTITWVWNRDDIYSGVYNAYGFKLNAPTLFQILLSDEGNFWKIELLLLGFGFHLSRQATY